MNERGHGMKDGNILHTLLLAMLVGLGGWNLYTTHQLSTQMEIVRAQLNQATKGKWSTAHQAIWSGRLKESNPALIVPDPAEVSRQYEP